jgi:DNA modification methylase
MIHSGDLFDVLPTLPEASIDACVTDPPYGIGFMGREWDTFKPESVRTAAAMKQRKDPEQLANLKNVYGRKRSPAQSPSQVEYDYTVAGLRGFQDWTAKWAAEVFRVLKPGAYVVVCGAPRSHHRMMCGLEDAGFVVRDCFAWLFGSGFPKNRNLGDGRGTALKPAHEPIALAWKPFKGSITANVAAFGTGALNIDAARIRPTSQDDSRSTSGGSSAYTSLLRAASQTLHIAHSELSASSDEQPEPLESLLANALSHDLLTELREGFQAGCLPCRGCDDGRVRLVGAVGRAFVQQRDGARGPLDLQWIASRIRESRCGDHPSIWDALAQRVSSSNYTASDVEKRGRDGEESADRRYAERGATNFAATPGPRGGDDLGRWPANVLLGHSVDCGEDQDGDWCCVSYCPVRLLDEQTGELTSGAFDCKRSQDGPTRAVYGGFPSGTPALTTSPYQGDRGGASRFYYVAKPSREERDMGCYDLAPQQRDDSRKEGNPGGDNPRNRGLQPRGNFHPTVKPIELMRWLVRLVTPPGGTVLDPFTGSGTTGIACVYEQRPFVGIEREAEYVAIAERRIHEAAPLFAGDGVRLVADSAWILSENNR